MFKTSFSAELISSSEALKHFKISDNGTLYHNPDFVEFILDDVLWLGGFKKNKLLCTMPIFKNYFPDFFYYTGPLWSKDWSNLKSYRRYSTSQKIYQEMISYLFKIRENIIIQFPNTSFDIRAFDWWNYGKEEHLRFKTTVKYTAKIMSLQSKSQNQLVENLRSDDKKKRLRKVINKESNLEINDYISFGKFINLYRQTMSRGGGVVSNEKILILERLYNYVIDFKKGFIMTISNSSSKEIIGSQLVIYEGKTANAIAQGFDQRLYSSEFVTYLIFNSILRSKAEGIDVFDFNGANSPMRADDKHAYGAEEVAFFSLEYGL